MGQRRDARGVPLPNQYVIPKNTKLTSNYSFTPGAKTVVIEESDFKNLVLIINITTSEIIYNPTTDITSGTTTGRSVSLTFDTTSMSSADKLLVLYEYSEPDIIDSLSMILCELQKHTKLLTKIYR